MLAPPLPDVPLPSPGNEPTTLAAPAPVLGPLGKEKKNGAKKKCLYNFQDAFLEAKQVVMATSAATSSVSCTATTVQSSNNFLEVASKRPTSLGKGGRAWDRQGIWLGISLGIQPSFVFFSIEIVILTWTLTELEGIFFFSGIV